MANYYATARSNYFKVKDAEAFKTWAGEITGLGVWEQADGTFGLYDDSGDGGGWCCYRQNESGDEEDFELVPELGDHLTDDSVAVLMEAGAEKLRYVSGHAVAVNSKGEVLDIHLHDIYKLAAEKFGITPTPAEY